ncbi:NADH dehydrogenase [ubiquinone] 1 alpha subcomplex subunit 1 [Gossypium australe]|uniref:NADH dehydrogenase [ubiquinone] 1 alpha subcomplex subunit 1 n=1 Tax=Gossypium australe TaxID=47621 RepID=A0A5B6WDR4_9ROSI|nr:NADH dehydrogenase [ubiquinone] 1 alpha subcomplex subunit 1 [Gossypium australe]
MLFTILPSSDKLSMTNLNVPILNHTVLCCFSNRVLKFPKVAFSWQLGTNRGRDREEDAVVLRKADSP